jgi:hypothetical protein
MNLPQPPTGKVPNIEILWAGDVASGHLSVSLKVGTFFGVSNKFAGKIAREAVDCEELCECDIHNDTGDIMASFHVEPANWPDFAHAIVKKVYMYVAGLPAEWNARNREPAHAGVVGARMHLVRPRRLN